MFINTARALQLLVSVALLPAALFITQAVALAAEPAATPLPVSKAVSLKDLEKLKSIKVTVDEDGKQVAYSGVPLRAMLAEMVPDVQFDSMPEWKALSRRQLVMVVTGDDGYPGIVTAIDLAINKAGDRFLLATHRDGKVIEKGVHLICKMDEFKVRWVRQVVSLRVVAVPK